MNAEPPTVFGIAFLRWLREETEQASAHVEDWTLADYAQRGLIGPRWRRGTRWTGGLGDDAVSQAETRYRLRFPPHHRLFMQTLHSTTPQQRCADYLQDGSRLTLRDTPGFYDWEHDDHDIRRALANLRDNHDAITQLLADMQHPGPHHGRPIPDLIPIYGHRYVLTQAPHWVLSVANDEAIVYGWDLRDYLLHELADVLN